MTRPHKVTPERLGRGPKALGAAGRNGAVEMQSATRPARPMTDLDRRLATLLARALVADCQ